jgi:hypothetical protein
MERFDRGAELALLGTVVTVVAAWSYHLRVKSNHLHVAETVVTTADAIHVVDSAEATVPDSAQEQSAGGATMQSAPPAPTHTQAAENETLAFHKERVARGKLLHDLHAQLATLSDARADGWSAIFAPLPSSETQQQKETAKRAIVARIRQIEAM